MYDVPHILSAMHGYTYITCVYVCTHRVITGPYFVEVFGLPDHPMLADVNVVLKHSSGEKYVQCYKYIFVFNYYIYLGVFHVEIHWCCFEMFLRESTMRIPMLDPVHYAHLTNC